jgi:hypothetical protein
MLRMGDGIVRVFATHPAGRRHRDARLRLRGFPSSLSGTLSIDHFGEDLAFLSVIQRPGQGEEERS